MTACSWKKGNWKGWIDSGKEMNTRVSTWASVTEKGDNREVGEKGALEAAAQVDRMWDKKLPAASDIVAS
jgi:hypothetical protein